MKESRKIAEISKAGEAACFDGTLLSAEYLRGRLALLRSQEAAAGAVFEKNIAGAVSDTVEFLSSAEAAAALALDPYWPKWTGPWWQTLLLFELGHGDRIPRSFLLDYVDLVERHYLHFFPLTLSEVPEGCDPVSRVACHCFLGTYVQLVEACLGINLSERHRWLDAWFIRYRLEDGGLNCEEDAYTWPQPKSSITSTVPVLEALLARCRGPEAIAQYGPFVDRGMEYILQRKLFRSLSTGQVIDPAWQSPAFPRVYEYDVMRGLQLVINYSLSLGRPIQAASFFEALGLVDACLNEQGFVQGTSHCRGVKTRVPQGLSLPLKPGFLADCPPLLQLCDQPGQINLPLARSYDRILTGLIGMIEAGLIIMPVSDIG